MELIIDFYKSLDTLNLIIFWGIIVVIILLLIFSSILVNKNKKLKKIIDKNNKYEEELPIKKEETIKEEKNTITVSNIPKIQKENNVDSKPIETEIKFIAEEHVMEYNKEQTQLYNVNNTNEISVDKLKTEINIKKPIEMPTGPYQRNVLREMSLSQTSPIGITRPINKDDKKLEMAKDLEKSLNNEEQTQKEIEQIKKELTNIENTSQRKTEIRNENILNPKKEEERRVGIEEVRKTVVQTQNANNTENRNKEILKRPSQIREENKKEDKVASFEEKIQNEAKYYAKELISIKPQVSVEESQNASSSKYLEEVSRKLAEAEMPDEIERTNYELKQEEDAIISYKELMQKKDSIQTIDEEEAIISIEELMNRNNKQTGKEEIIGDTRLYNLSDDEENDNFIKELKQFRNDL